MTTNSVTTLTNPDKRKTTIDRDVKSEVGKSDRVKALSRLRGIGRKITSALKQFADPTTPDKMPCPSSAPTMTHIASVRPVHPELPLSRLPPSDRDYGSNPFMSPCPTKAPNGISPETRERPRNGVRQDAVGKVGGLLGKISYAKDQQVMASERFLEGWAKLCNDPDVEQPFAPSDIDGCLTAWETAFEHGVRLERPTKQILTSQALLSCIGKRLIDVSLPLKDRYALLERYVANLEKAHAHKLLSSDKIFAVLVGTGGKIHWNKNNKILSDRTSRGCAEGGSITSMLFLDQLAPAAYAFEDHGCAARFARAYASLLTQAIVAKDDAWIKKRIATLRSETGYGLIGTVDLLSALDLHQRRSEIGSQWADIVGAAFRFHSYKPGTDRPQSVRREAYSDPESVISRDAGHHGVQQTLVSAPEGSSVGSPFIHSRDASKTSRVNAKNVFRRLVEKTIAKSDRPPKEKNIKKAAKDEVEEWRRRCSDPADKSFFAATDINACLQAWRHALALRVVSEDTTKQILTSRVLLTRLGERLIDTRFPAEDRYTLLESYVEALGEAYANDLLSARKTFAVLIGTSGKIHWGKNGKVVSHKASHGDVGGGSVTAKLLLDQMASTNPAPEDLTRSTKLAVAYARVLTTLFERKGKSWTETKLRALKSEKGYGPLGKMNLFNALKTKGHAGEPILLGADVVDAVLSVHGYKPGKVRTHAITREEPAKLHAALEREIDQRINPPPVGLFARIRASFSRFAGFVRRLFGPSGDGPTSSRQRGVRASSTIRVG